MNRFKIKNKVEIAKVGTWNDFEMTETELKIQWVMERPEMLLTGERGTVRDLIDQISSNNVDHQIFKKTGMKTISFK